MVQVPSNLSPVRVTQLIDAPVVSPDGLLIFIYQGNTYKVRAGDLLQIAAITHALTADYATEAGHALTSDNSVQASNAAVAASTAVALDGTNAARYLAFYGATVGAAPVLVDMALTYNPSTDTLQTATVVATNGIYGGTF